MIGPALEASFGGTTGIPVSQRNAPQKVEDGRRSACPNYRLRGPQVVFRLGSVSFVCNWLCLKANKDKMPWWVWSSQTEVWTLLNIPAGLKAPSPFYYGALLDTAPVVPVSTCPESMFLCYFLEENTLEAKDSLRQNVGEV